MSDIPYTQKKVMQRFLTDNGFSDMAELLDSPMSAYLKYKWVSRTLAREGHFGEAIDYLWDAMELLKEQKK